MTHRPISRLARDVQSAVNKRDLARGQQDRDQILATMFAGTGKGTAAQERYDSRAAVLASLEETITRLSADLRNALDDLTPSQGTGDDESAPSPKPKKRKKQK